tara:strand:+ start:503 stop:853 length:351 start_codon:yes stop_codon:yes gene_type:complete
VDKSLNHKAMQLSECLENLLKDERSKTKAEDYSGLAEIIEKKNNLLAELLELSSSLEPESKAFVSKFMTQYQAETQKNYDLLGDEKVRLHMLLISMQKKKKQLKAYSIVKEASNYE